MPDPTHLPPICPTCNRRPIERQVLVDGAWHTFNGCACTWTGSPEAAAAAAAQTRPPETG